MITPPSPSAPRKAPWYRYSRKNRISRRDIPQIHERTSRTDNRQGRALQHTTRPPADRSAKHPEALAPPAHPTRAIATSSLVLLSLTSDFHPSPIEILNSPNTTVYMSVKPVLNLFLASSTVKLKGKTSRTPTGFPFPDLHQEHPLLHARPTSALYAFYARSKLPYFDFSYS